MEQHGGDTTTDTTDEDTALVWWLVKLGQEDRELYRRVRAIAWEIASANPERSAIPNQLS